MSNHLGKNYNLWKQKLFEKKEEISVKAEAIARSVLKCLESNNDSNDLKSYLNEAKLFSKQKLASLTLFLHNLSSVS